MARPHAIAGNTLASDICRGVHGVDETHEFDPALILAIIQILIALARCWLDLQAAADAALLQRVARRRGPWGLWWRRWLSQATEEAAGSRERFERLGGRRLVAEINRQIQTRPLEAIEATLAELAEGKPSEFN